MISKYTPENLLPALRLFAKARNQSNEMGFTDNGGAIHSVERILDILSMRICYPHLRHINSLKSDPNAEISKNAYVQRKQGNKIKIEHVMPQRAFARVVIALIDKGNTDAQLVKYIKKHYRLVLLSEEETKIINRMNRSKITPDRIADAKIALHQR